MILSITMNPSVDISYPLNQLTINDINRVSDVKKTAGGKGLNVTRGIKAMQIPVIASGIIGGTTGEYIQKALDDDGILYDFYVTPHESRNCIAILHEGNQTEILESGPVLTEHEMNGFLQHYLALLEHCQVVTISGSLPQGLSHDFYTTLIRAANQRKLPVLVDTSGPILLEMLTSSHKPYLIKPNNNELKQLINVEIDPNQTSSLIRAVNHPLLNDIPFVIMSLGKHGAFARCYDACYQVSIPKINVVNPVGSGDVTLAGLSVSIHENEDIESMLKRAMTMGMLNAMEAQTGFVNMHHYDDYYQQVTVNHII